MKPVTLSRCDGAGGCGKWLVRREDGKYAVNRNVGIAQQLTDLEGETRAFMAGAFSAALNVYQLVGAAPAMSAWDLVCSCRTIKASQMLPLPADFSLSELLPPTQGGTALW